MAEPELKMPSENDETDLPRTLRRARAEKERQESEATQPPTGAPTAGTHAARTGTDAGEFDAGYIADEVVVTDINIPFLRLMAFLIKATLAAIPALIILTLLLIGVGQALKAYFPSLRQAVVTIEIKSPE
ncbi:MAG: hypothetical protein AAGC70_18440 [Pseudomonadota bacterium]